MSPVQPTEGSSATPPPGAFPFPLTDGPSESRYLVWIRNHSNYMAVRGFLDYVRLAAVLLRGIVVNFLTLLPFLFVVSILLAYSHHWMLRHPFRLTLGAAGIAVAMILLFPVTVQLFRLSTYRKSILTGSDSSVRVRDRYERFFGALLLAVLGVALLEALPWLLEFFHDRLRQGTFTVPGGLAAVAGTLALLSRADRVLSRLGGVRQKLAMGLIGVLGLGVPLGVILYVSAYLLYGYPPSPLVITVPVIGAVAMMLTIIAAIGIGVLGRTFRRRELVYATGLLLGAVVIVLAGLPMAVTMASTARNEADQALRTLVEPVTRLADALGEISPPATLDAETARLLEETAARNATWHRVRQEVVHRQAQPVAPAVPPPGFWNALRDREVFAAYYNWANLSTFWSTEQTFWATNRLAFSARERHLVPLVDALLARPEGSRAALRPALAQAARVQLAEWVRFAPETGLEDSLTVAMMLETGLDEGVYAPDALYARNALRERYEENVMALTADQLQRIVEDSGSLAGDLAARLVYGRLAGLEPDTTGGLRRELTRATIPAKATFVLLLAVVTWLACWLTVDVNLTSIHSLYRDRLASAFLVGRNLRGDVDIEDDVDLHQLCRYEAGSTAPYHLVNVALNLQASRDPGLRDRQSDFFVFSKRFIGGARTGYCRSEVLEQVFPQMSLGSAMAISAAAASPNMGRSTSPLLVAFMTLLNIRLGYWMPHPGLLEEGARSAGGWPGRRKDPAGVGPPGFRFPEVFQEELGEIERRWARAYPDLAARRTTSPATRAPTTAHGLVGLAFSGGGIRSAAINLGITQALHRRGVFDHVDYMSTVSGGGYLGSSLSTLMRARAPVEGDPAPGEVPTSARCRSAIAGMVTVTPEPSGDGGSLVTVQGTRAEDRREYRVTRYDALRVRTGDQVTAGEDLVRRRDGVGDRFRWRVRPMALLREMFSRLDETHRWVNLSDGGHIENLASIELLRRRCRFVIVGDGEADPLLHFAGMATLMRSARLDLGIDIDIDLDAVRLGEPDPDTGRTPLGTSHWAVGTITYPRGPEGQAEETGLLLYLKSSVTGDEDEVIREYRHRNPAFPHETTADQFFDEGQFEAYRSLGQHIAESALGEGRGPMSYGELAGWFEGIAPRRSAAVA